jgi:hypothetical protein
VRDWLLKKRSTERDLNIAVVAFLRALFDMAGDHIARIWRQRQPGDSRAAHTIFSGLMNDGGTFTTPPTYRTDFYAKVVDSATKVCSSVLISVVRELIIISSKPKPKPSSPFHKTSILNPTKMSGLQHHRSFPNAGAIPLLFFPLTKLMN